MKLCSVNLSLPRDVDFQGKTVSTGIFKEPVPHRVQVRHLGLVGDGQADLVAHGGVFKAVYTYPIEHYEYWQRESGRDPFPCGQFGENLTVEGMLETNVCVGDIFQIGSATVEVSQPRVPCFKLGIKMGSQDFLKPFLKSGRVGFYLRVLREGEVGSGDQVTKLGGDSIQMSVRDISHLYYFDKDNMDDRKRALQIKALSPGWREGFEEQLDSLSTS